MTCRLLGCLLFSMALLAQSPGEGISRELARARARRISDLRYRISLELAPDSDRLPGRIEISFHLADASGPVVLDYRDSG